MRYALPLWIALAGCSESAPDVRGIQKELAELRRQLDEQGKVRAETRNALDELAKARAEIDGALDDLRGEVRKLREKPPAPAPAPPPRLSAVPTSHAENDLYWVFAPTTVKGEQRTALVLYRASSRGFQIEGARLLEDDIAKALK
jgi:hypothetical protein